MSIFFKDRYEYYSIHARAHGYRSIWSIYTVDDLAHHHPFGDATTVVYRDHWGTTGVVARIAGHAWSDLWRAAEDCIRSSGDGHHVFIEDFTPDPNDHTVIYLSTGS